MLAQYLGNLEPQRPAKWACLEAHLPGKSPTRVGVVLLEPCRDRLYIRIKPYWWNDLVDVEEGQIWEGLSEDLSLKAEEMGATIFLNWLEDCCSHSLQMGATQEIKMRQPETCISRLYGEHVDQPAICSVVHKASASRTLRFQENTAGQHKPLWRRAYSSGPGSLAIILPVTSMLSGTSRLFRKPLNCPSSLGSTTKMFNSISALVGSLLVVGRLAGRLTSQHRLLARSSCHTEL
jgi:hypothetical protein